MKKYKVVGLPQMQLGGPGDGRKRRRKTIKEQEEEKLKDFDEVSVVSGNTDANEYNRGFYGNKHYATKRSIEQSLDRMRQDYTKGNYVRTDDGSWDYDKSYAAEANYDSDVEDLFRRYNEIENQMYLNFGDRKGDPTKAKDWMNADGRLYRKRLRALESDIQDLFLRRQEKRGDITGTTKVNAEGVANQFTRVPLRDKEFIQEEISREGYVPRKYQLNFEDMVVYPTEALKKKQEKLSAKAEELFMEGMREGYGPSSAVPIGGSIEQLQKFIKDQKSNFKDFKKNRAELEKQSAKDASYIGISIDDLGTDAGYAALRRRMKENPNDGGLITIYRKHFQPLGYGVTQQLTEKERQQAELAFRGFTGNDRLDAIMDPTRAATNAALVTSYVPAVAWSAPAFFNPTIQTILAPYFAYEAVKPDGILDQAADEFAKGEYLSGTIDAGFGLLDVFAMKGLMKTLKTPGAVEKLFSKLKNRNLPKGYLEKINNELPPMLRLDNIDDIPRSLSVPSVTKVSELGPGQKSIPESSDQLIAADLIEGMDDADIPLDVNEALVKLTDEQFKKVTGTDKWIYKKLVEVDPATSARTYKNKVDSAKMNSGVATLNSAESFNKVAQEGNMPFTDILKVKTAANDGKQKAIDWVSSDQFLQRVVDSRGVSIDEAKQIQAEFLDNIERIPMELKAYDENARVRGALTSNEVGEVVIRAHAPKVEGFDSSNVMQLDDLSGTIMHEYLHAANLASGENMKGIEFLPDLKIPEGAKPIVRKNIVYLNKHPEQQVRAVRAIQLAQEAGIIKANEKFTEASLNKLRDYIDEEGWIFGIAGYKDLPLLLDPVKTGKTIKDKDVVNLLNTAYQYVLPVIGGAGAATLAATSDDEATTATVMASLPLMFTKGSMGKSFNQVFKNIRNLFRGVGQKVPFTQAELQSDILKNLPAKYKKISREKLDELFTEDPDLIGNLIMETIIKRTGYVKGKYKKNLSEAELPIALAEQNEAAQFALDFNSAWMEGAINSETKELMQPVIKAIKNLEPHEKRTDILKKEYNDLVEIVRKDFPQDYYRKVLFGDGSVSDKEAKVIINDLLSEYQKLYKNLDNRTQVGDKGVIGQMINELKTNLDIIDQQGVKALQNRYPITKIYQDATKIAEAKDPRKMSRLKLEINVEESLYIEANDAVIEELEKIGDVSDLPLPTDIKNKVDALRNNYLPIEHINPSNNLLNRIHTNINTAEAQALEARGTLGKQAPSDEIISGLIEGRIDDPSIKNTVAETRADQKYLNQVLGFQASGKYGTPSQVTKRSKAKKLASGDLEDVYMAYTKSKNKPKGFVKYRQDDYYSPEEVMTTIAHEDRHIYQDILKYLEGHVQYSPKFGYNIPGGSSIGKKLREVAIDPKEYVPTLKERLKGKKKGDKKTYESWLSSPAEIDADLAADRVEFAYGIYKKIMETPGAMEDASREDVIEYIVTAMKLPEKKKEFIENIMNSELGFRISKHFKENYRGAINPDLDSPEVMANKEFIRLFLEALPAALIGIGLMGDMSDSESNYKKGGSVEIELDDDEVQDYIRRGYTVEEID